MKGKIRPSVCHIICLLILMIGITIGTNAKPQEEAIITIKPVKLSYSIYQFKAEISFKQNVKEVGFCYSDHELPTVADKRIICNQSKESNAISTILAQNQLKKGETYYIRAYCISGRSILYGNQESMSLEDQQYEVGQKAFGGIIAYIFGPGDKQYVKGEIHGIIAAETDLPNKHTWSTAIEVNEKKNYHFSNQAVW